LLVGVLQAIHLQQAASSAPTTFVVGEVFPATPCSHSWMAQASFNPPHSVTKSATRLGAAVPRIPAANRGYYETEAQPKTHSLKAHYRDPENVRFPPRRPLNGVSDKIITELQAERSFLLRAVNARAKTPAVITITKFGSGTAAIAAGVNRSRLRV